MNPNTQQPLVSHRGRTRRIASVKDQCLSVCSRFIFRITLLCLWSVTLASQLSAEPQQLGSWSGLIAWPHVPSSVAVLPDGKLVTWSSNELTSFPDNGVRFSYSSVFDPRTRQFTETNNPSHDMFCAGTSLLSDGTLVAAGGNPQLQDTSYFDPQTNRWVQGPFMNHQRWYGTTLTLPDDSVFATFARGDNNIPELLPRNGAWTELPDAAMTTLFNEQTVINNSAVNDSVIAQWNANMQLAPNGRVFHAGPTSTMHWLDTDGTGLIEAIGPRMAGDQHRQGDSFSLYDIGKILMTGGSDKSREPSATATALRIDINGAMPEVLPTDSMISARVYHNAVVLPTGEVMIVGGNSSGILFDDSTSVLDTEIWNPATGRFRTTAPIAVGRNYHSVAVLMQDGRVFSGGGGLCGNCDVNHPDAQIYSPPYLYDSNGAAATRPVISSAPSQMQAGAFGLLTIDSNLPIAELSLIRLSSNTHSVNTDERRVPVNIQAISENLYQITLPDNPNILVPGNYWLFAIDSNGVPSEGYSVNLMTGTAELEARLTLPQLTQQSLLVGEPVNLQLRDLISSPAQQPDDLNWQADTLPAGLVLNADSGIISGQINEMPIDAELLSSKILVRSNNQAAVVTIQWRVTEDSGFVAVGGTGMATLLLLIFALTRVSVLRARRHR